MQSVKTFFAYMNDINFKYCVLRNWESLPFDVCLGEHSDLDLLVYDFSHFFEIFPEAKLEHPLPRVRTRIPIEDTYIYADVRYIGDGYFPEDFQRAILETRELNSRGFYTPDPMHHRVALAYHAAHHKNDISKEYTKYLGDATINQLLEVLKQSSVGWVEPTDKTVGKYHGYWKGATSVVSINGDRVIKEQVGWSSYNLLSNEYRILLKAQTHGFIYVGPSTSQFPKVYSYENGRLEMEHCGEPLESNIPDDWREQLDNILLGLKYYHIQHRDIRLGNLTVKDGKIFLIDFGWAKFDDETDVIEPPSCLGYPNKSSQGFSDSYSMGCVRRQLEYQIEMFEESENDRKADAVQEEYLMERNS